MSKILNFKSFQDDDDELLEMQKSALKSTSEPEVTLRAASQAPAPGSRELAGSSLNDTGRVSVLEKNTVITGSISSVTTIEIDGIVNGNVSCQSDVLVNGTVTGDIDAANVKLTSGHVKGNILCKSAVSVDKDSVVEGNISGDSLDCDGKVEGNTRLKGKVTVTSHAAIYGDISAGSISIEEGVELKGMLNISKSAKKEDAKPEKTVKEVKNLNIDGSKYI